MEQDNLTIAFTIWAAVVGMIGIAIVWELSRMRLEIKELRADFNKLTIGTERRVTHIESHLSNSDEKFTPWGHM
jgi:hypothetical protein